MTLPESDTFHRLPADAAAALLRSNPASILFDVRDLKSYQSGHLEGAMHLSQDRLPIWLTRLSKEQAVIIYCYKGNASQSYAQMFSDFRFTRVVSVDGGYEALAAAWAGD